MLFVENNNTDPYINHALEEWLMERYSRDCFMLWRNTKSILLGRNQNARQEINLEYAKEHGISIARRITGGGAVFTDAGNLMFTFISCTPGRDFRNFTGFAGPVLAALRELGVPAEFTGRNDLTVDGKKISGNAQCLYKGKVLHHGTLMFSADTAELALALNVPEIKLRDKGVESVKSRVTNISEYISREMSIEDFREYLFESVISRFPGAERIRLTANEWTEVAAKAAKKHSTPQWIYGREARPGIRR